MLNEEQIKEKREKIKALFRERWKDPVKRVEDIFNVRTGQGDLVPLKVPEPQKKILREGILSKEGSESIRSGDTILTVTNKGRQLGFSHISMVKAILACEDFPNTHVYYVATKYDNVRRWMDKLNQLILDANHWPAELGGGPMISIQKIDKIAEKTINNTTIHGLAANPASIRGDTGVLVFIDEMDWMTRTKNQQVETWKAVKYFIRQGGEADWVSTPRINDSLFYSTFKEPTDMGFISYYCPVIENWKELDMNKPLYIPLDNDERIKKRLLPLDEEEKQRIINRYQGDQMFNVTETHIEQNMIILYPWINKWELEKDRLADLEQFKQESLGVPFDESIKVLKIEDITTNMHDENEWIDRGESKNPFYITMDVAQVNDVTAIGVIEKIGNIYYQRKIEQSQSKYDEQVEQVWDLYLKFRPISISIDNTGVGRAVADGIERKIKKFGLNTEILKRIDFTNSIKEQLAIGFRNIVKAGRYKFLDEDLSLIHREAIRHCTRVEKIVGDNSTKYSGKMHGRDDFFWSYSMVSLIDFDNLSVKTPLKFASYNKGTGNSDIKKAEVSDNLMERKVKVGNNWITIRHDEKQANELIIENKNKEIERILNLHSNDSVCLIRGVVDKEITCIDCPDTCKNKKSIRHSCNRGILSFDEVSEQWQKNKVKK